MEPKEFYKLMEEKKEEIKSLDMSEDKKNNLYQLVDETIKRYEENKSNYAKSQTALGSLEKILSLNLKHLLKNSKPASNSIH